MSADNRICILRTWSGQWAVWHGSASCDYYEEPPSAALLNTEAEALARATQEARECSVLEYGIQRITVDEQRRALAETVSDLRERLKRLKSTGSQFPPSNPPSRTPEAVPSLTVRLPIPPTLLGQVRPASDASDKEWLDALTPQEREEVGDLFLDAVAVVRRARRASTSIVQRRLRIGYNRAWRILEVMQRIGLIGPESGCYPREVLFT